MIFDARIGLRQLAMLCRRLATSLSAGIDVRSVFSREAGAAQGAGRGRLAAVQQQVAGGTSVADAIAETGDYFPEFFRSLVRVGEDSGQLAEIFRRLAEHYEHQLKLRRVLLASLAWPLIELVLSAGVVGLVIWLMGVVPALAASKLDILGFGLTGNKGLLIYLLFWAVLIGAGVVVYRAVTRGALWIAPVQRVVLSLPGIGRPLQTMALTHLAWAMHVTLNTGMDVRQAMKASLAATRNAVYTQHTSEVMNSLSKGNSIHAALRATGVFPDEFLDNVEVGEESGNLVETMGGLSEQYQDSSRAAMAALTVLLGTVVTALIASVIIFVILRMGMFYRDLLINATKM